jgi:hypothetical protein
MKPTRMAKTRSPPNIMIAYTIRTWWSVMESSNL